MQLREPVHVSGRLRVGSGTGARGGPPGPGWAQALPDCRPSFRSAVSWPWLAGRLLGRFPLRLNFCKTVSGPMLSGRLLSWYQSRHKFCNAASWLIISWRSIAYNNAKASLLQRTLLRPCMR